MTTAGASASAANSVCPNCSDGFTRRRANQRFCSDRCRKSAQKRMHRISNPSNARFSATKHREQMLKFDTAMRLAEMYYTIPPSERFGFLEELVHMARLGEVPMLRDILSTPKLLNPRLSEKHLFYCFSPKRYRTIAQLADTYCRLSPWRSSVVDVVKGKVAEPPTGEVRSDGTIDDGPGFDVSMRKASTPYYMGDKGEPRVHLWYFSEHPLLRNFHTSDLAIAA